MPDNTEARDIITTAQEAVAAEAIAPSVWLADSGRQIIDLYDTLVRREPTPPRKTGLYQFTDPAGLVNYLNKHATPDTEIYAAVSQGTITAVINAHETYLSDGGQAGWGDHRAVLKLRSTQDWIDWVGGDRKWLKQDDFAEFVEAHLPNFLEPDGATVLELAQEFRARKSVRFDSSSRVKSGETRITWHEEIEAKAGKGSIDIPDTIAIALQPYERGEVVGLTARLRYRINEGTLALGWVLDRPDDVLRAVFDNVVEEVSTGSGIEVWHGVSA